MEHLYHIHPVFEFFLTAYLGFLVAPKFLSEFLVDRLPKYGTRNKEKMLANLVSLQRTIHNIIKDFERSGLSNHPLVGKPLRKFVNEKFVDLRNRIEKKTKEISSYDDDIIKAELVERFKYRFNPIFIFAGFINLVFLILNGCGWSQSEANSNDILIYISDFNFLSGLSMLGLANRRYLCDRKTKLTSFFKKKECHFIYVLLVMFVVLFFSFYLPTKVNKEYVAFISFSEIWFKIFVFAGSVLIASFPLLWYSFRLNRDSRKSYEVLFGDDYIDSRNKLAMYRIDFDAHLKKWIKIKEEAQ